MGFQKPNNLHYRNLMDTVGESLLKDENSTEIYSLVRLQRLAEKIATHHLAKQPAPNPEMECLNDEVNIQIFLNELNDWRNSTSEDIKNLRTSPKPKLA
jgi:hypothetical protein